RGAQMTQSAGKAVPHDSALGHVTGQAPDIDDMRTMTGDLHVGFVRSPFAAWQLRGVDTSAALAIPGVIGCYTVADVPGHNLFGVVVMDEPFLAEGEVRHLGQPVAVVAAESPAALEKGRKAVRVECRAAEPILDLPESIRRQKFLGPCRKIGRGEVDSQLAAAKHK